MTVAELKALAEKSDDRHIVASPAVVAALCDVAEAARELRHGDDDSANALEDALAALDEAMRDA